jgi:hypothetical protein
MSPSLLAYLGGMLLVFLGQRVLDGHDGWQLAIRPAWARSGLRSGCACAPIAASETPARAWDTATRCF